MWGHMWGIGDVGWGWMVMGWVWMVVFWGAIIGLVVWAVSRLTGENRSTNVSALDIARARYARGEIGKEEFEELRQALQ